MARRNFNDDDFNEHYHTTYSKTGRDFGYYQPAYRYGYDLASEEAYRNRDWGSFEADARRNWEQRNRDTIWDDIKDAVREGWQRVKDTFD